MIREQTFLFGCAIIVHITFAGGLIRGEFYNERKNRNNIYADKIN